MPTTPYTGLPVTLKLPTPLDPATLDVWGRQLNEQGFAPLTAAVNSIIAYLNGDTVLPAPIVPPVAAIAAPATGDTISGSFTISARVSATQALAGVAAYIANNKLTDLTLTTANTWAATGLDSARYPDGSYILTVRAIDSLGNIGTDSITVTVNNTIVTAYGITTELGIPLAAESGDQLEFDNSPIIPPALSAAALTNELGDGLTTELAEQLEYDNDPTALSATAITTEAGDGLTTTAGEQLEYDLLAAGIAMSIETGDPLVTESGDPVLIETL